MRLAIVMAVQAMAGPPVPADLRPAKPALPAVPCGETDARGDIVVCARARNADRLPRLDADRYAQQPIRAATGIGKVRVSAEAEQGTLPNGQSSPRAMLRLKLPF
ncbi:5'-nucleotidase [Sphingomonas sp. RP10(2022)]|uniref:5'-nucleotidase n=1 Tax=Sphingomonas liriopis TaxID=2949094 RepID=A0A9X2KQR2_9SPHN|nr:5'-nucleotidase [Sphingomonas liriopis]MCP3735999.1 5'-nucleotidase [Sphingomonas liriopis]